MAKKKRNVSIDPQYSKDQKGKVVYLEYQTYESILDKIKNLDKKIKKLKTHPSHSSRHKK